MKRIVIVLTILVFSLPFMHFLLAQEKPQVRQPPVRATPQQPQIQKGKDTLKLLCPGIQFISSSPLPSTTVLSDYTYQVKTSGGVGEITFKASTLDMSQAKKTVNERGEAVLGGGGDVGGLPAGLSMSPSGLIKGQTLFEGQHRITITASDHCPNGVQTIEKAFVLNVNKK